MNSSHPDIEVVYGLHAMALFDSARRLAQRLGPELFPELADRIIAKFFIDGREPAYPGPRLAAQVLELIGHVERAAFPPRTNEAWGLAFIRVLADRAWRPILAATLRWAAAEVEAERQPLRWIARQVIGAFRIAMGLVPPDLDQSSRWEEATTP